MTDSLVTVVVPPVLRLFVRGRAPDRVVCTVQPEWSLGHLVTSIGIPLTEVGEIVVAGRAVPAGMRACGADVVVLSEVSRPQPAPTTPPRFLLDVHLGVLCRRLRLLGLDCAYRNDSRDADLVRRSLAEQRVLLSRDRGLLRRRALRWAAYVRGDDPVDQLRDVLDRFAPPLTPWSRCLVCNGLLSAVPKDLVQDVLKPGTRRCYQDFARCDGCRRVFWRGAHARRLESIVESVESVDSVDSVDSVSGRWPNRAHPYGDPL